MSYKQGVRGHSLPSIFRLTSLPTWQRAVGFGAAYLLCSETGAYLSVPGSTQISFWLPAGLYLAVLLLNDYRVWPWLVLAGLPANLIFDHFHGTAFIPIFFFYLANTLQAITGAWLMRRLVAARPKIATLKEFISLMALAGVFATALGATIGAATLKTFGLTSSFGQSWKVWWGSCTMAILVFTPFILTWFARPGESGRSFNSAKRLAEAALLFLGLIVFEWYIFTMDQGVMSPNKSWAIPLLLWAGLRFGPRGATAAGLFLSLTVAFFTTQFKCGLTPAQVASGDYVFVMQVVLAMTNLVAIIPAVVLSERDQAIVKLRESEERFRTLTHAAFEGVAISEGGRFLDLNDQLLKMFGCERSEIIGREVIEFVAPEWRDAVRHSIRTNQETLIGHRLLRKDGSSFFAEAQSKTVRSGGRTVRMTAVRDITERKLTEEALRESEEKFSKAFRASPDGMAISELETGRYVEINEGYCRLFGYAREEMLGHTSIELGIWSNPQDRERMVAGLKTDGEVRSLEIHTRTRSGEPRQILLSADAIDLAGQASLVSVLHDVTDRIRAERALRESEEKFSKAFHTSPDVIAITDLETGGYLDVNMAHEKTYGIKREEAIGRSPLELGIQKDPGLRQKLAVNPDRPSIRNIEIETYTRDGRALTMLHSAELIEIGGRPCALRVSHDITEQKRAEAERAESIAREQLARAQYTFQLIASQEGERQRIAGELHDSLGQSVSIIKNRLQFAMLQTTPPADWRAQLGEISDLAAQAIAELRRISRDLHPYQLDHLGFTRALGALLNTTAENCGIAFTQKIEPVDDAFSKAAAMQLYRVVQESLNNILKHARASHVGVTLERDVHEVHLLIADDGCGFNPDATAGQGMGLHNIAERVRMLGGQLTVDSQPGSGTRLNVTIPIRAE